MQTIWSSQLDVLEFLKKKGISHFMMWFVKCLQQQSRLFIIIYLLYPKYILLFPTHFGSFNVDIHLVQSYHIDV